MLVREIIYYFFIEPDKDTYCLMAFCITQGIYLNSVLLIMLKYLSWRINCNIKYINPLRAGRMSAYSILGWQCAQLRHCLKNEYSAKKAKLRGLIWNFEDIISQPWKSSPNILASHKGIYLFYNPPANYKKLSFFLLTLMWMYYLKLIGNALINCKLQHPPHCDSPPPPL